MVGTNDAFLMLYRPTLPRRSRRRWRRGSRWGRWNAGRGARRRWRRGHRLPGVRRLRPSRERDLVALGVHALHVGHVVAVLHRLVCARGIARAHGRPSEETPARADRRPDARVPGGGANRGADCGAYGGPDGRSADCALRGRPLRRRPGLLRCPLTADRVIGLKQLKVLPVPRKHHHARPSGHRRAGRQEDPGCHGEDAPSRNHRFSVPSTQASAGP